MKLSTPLYFRIKKTIDDMLLKRGRTVAQVECNNEIYDMLYEHIFVGEKETSLMLEAQREGCSERHIRTALKRIFPHLYFPTVCRCCCAKCDAMRRQRWPFVSIGEHFEGA
jgi:hypothetical protein